MLSAQIKNTEVANIHHNIATVVATVQGLASMSSQDEILVALSAATGHKMSAIAGSVVMMGEYGPNEGIFRAAMVPATEALDASAAGNMTALSSNMFMDRSEKLWALRGSGDQSVLVRSVSEDPNELLDMMASCSSNYAVEAARDPILRKSCEAFAASISAVEGSDIVAFVNESSAVDVGFVSHITRSAAGEETLTIASMSGDAHDISREAILSVIPSANIEYSDDVILSQSAANVNPTKQLLDYYRRVFGHAPEYYKKLATIIRGHSFA